MQKLYEESNIQAIADAIRTKNGEETLYKTKDMAQAVLDLEARDPDCNGMHVPEDKLNFTGDCSYLFSYNNFAWLIEQCGDKITTKDVDAGSRGMFYNSSNLTEIPFEINMIIPKAYSSTTYKDTLDNFCNGCSKLSKYPMVNLRASTNDASFHKVKLCFASGTFKYAPIDEQFITKDDNVVIAGIGYAAFNYYNGAEEPTWLFDMVDWDEARLNKTYGSAMPTNWSNAKNLKTIPSLPKFWSDLEGTYSVFQQMKFDWCYNLQSIVLPRPGLGVLTSTPQVFGSSSWQYLYSMKSIKIDVQPDGTPYTAKWKNVTFNLCPATAYPIGGSFNNSENYMNPDKCVSDEESYQRLKNDPEYWVNINSTDPNSPYYQKYGYYSGFNHDAALELIKTLPDTSAYGTNTLKLPKDNGEGTDAGSIGTLTPEEISIATVKGWTITFV